MSLFDWREWQKTCDEQRTGLYKRIMKICKRECPVDYYKLVHILYIELGLRYYNNGKRGDYSRELDSLVVVGKLKAKGNDVYLANQL